MRDTVMKQGMSSANPCKSWRKIKSIPFCPPTKQVNKILASKITSTPNAHAEEMAKLAEEYLPKPGTFTGIQVPCEKQQTTIRAHWSRMISSYGINSAPDGTGLRANYF